MSIDAEPIAVTIRVAAELERLGVEYLVGGSLASSVHGLLRTTQDVDLVARIAGRHVIVLQKLDWYRKDDGISERQWKDTVGVAVQGARFDPRIRSTVGRADGAN